MKLCILGIHFDFFILRFDCSSSEAMSTDHARSSSSVVMESVSEPAHTTPTHSATPPPSTTSPSITSDTSTIGNFSTSQTLKTAHDSLSTDQSHGPERVPEAVCCQQQSEHLSGTSADRWLGSCSDDELETRRLELYKENRRKRYMNALEQKLSVSEHPKKNFYSSSN